MDKLAELLEKLSVPAQHELARLWPQFVGETLLKAWITISTGVGVIAVGLLLAACFSWLGAREPPPDSIHDPFPFCKAAGLILVATLTVGGVLVLVSVPSVVYPEVETIRWLLRK